jgi:histone H3/H4
MYPASKRKPEPFKPQRPSKVPRMSTTDSESWRPKKAAPAAARRPSKAQYNEDEDDGEGPGRPDALDSDSDDGLDEDPFATLAKRKAPVKPKAATSRRPPIDDDILDVRSSPPPGDPPPALSQSDETPQIPQPLLVRLLHEHFANRETKIDKHAVVVLQKYVEVFVREAIARTAMAKKERRDVDPDDAGWVDLEDLERIAPGLMLDF